MVHGAVVYDTLRRDADIEPRLSDAVVARNAETHERLPAAAGGGRAIASQPADTLQPTNPVRAGTQPTVSREFNTMGSSQRTSITMFTIVGIVCTVLVSVIGLLVLRELYRVRQAIASSERRLMYPPLPGVSGMGKGGRAEAGTPMNRDRGERDAMAEGAAAGGVAPGPWQAAMEAEGRPSMAAHGPLPSQPGDEVARTAAGGWVSADAGIVVETELDSEGARAYYLALFDGARTDHHVRFADFYATHSVAGDGHPSLRESESHMAQFIILPIGDDHGFVFPNPRRTYTEDMSQLFPELRRHTFEFRRRTINPAAVVRTDAGMWKVIGT